MSTADAQRAKAARQPERQAPAPPVITVTHGRAAPAELAAAADPEALRREKTAEYEDTLANPYIAAERGYLDAVIRPAETRAAVTRALISLRTKRETLPPKKHGNIPL